MGRIYAYLYTQRGCKTSGADTNGQTQAVPGQYGADGQQFRLVGRGMAYEPIVVATMVNFDR